MCGMVGVVRRRAQRAVPDSESLDRALVRALEVLDAAGPLAERLTAAAAQVEAVDRELRGAPGSKFEDAPPPVATSWCVATASTWPSPPSAGCSSRAPPIRSSGRDR